MKKIKLIRILGFTAIVSLMYFGVTVFAQPGTPEDPLVSRSYVDNRIAELEALVASLVAALEGVDPDAFDNNGFISDNGFYLGDFNGAEIGMPLLPPQVMTSPSTERELFRVVRAEPGMILIGRESTEIILRAGEAIITAGDNGIANVTSGIDLMNGQQVPLNNLMIVPQDDGRGLIFQTVAYLMIRGDFFFAGE